VWWTAENIAMASGFRNPVTTVLHAFARYGVAISAVIITFVVVIIVVVAVYNHPQLLYLASLLEGRIF
jgi:hypothetical protein